MASRLPNGTWRAQVYIGTDGNGKRIYKSFIADTKDEADYAALTFKLGRGKRVERKDITLRAAMTACIESKRGILSPSTILGYEIIVRNFGPFLDTHIMKITTMSLQRAINDYAFGGRADGKPGARSAKSVKNAYGFIKSVLRQNDVYVGDIALPADEDIEYATPFDAELTKIFEAVRGTTIELPVLLAAFCSLRRGEICGLRYSDVNFEDGTIRVERSRMFVKGVECVKAPKTKKSKRIVFVNDYILDLIKASGAKGNDYIIKLAPDTIGKRFGIELEKHGLPHCRFHDLRHSFASILHNHGVDMAYIRAIGGWASDRVLFARYLQTSPEHMRGKSKEANSIFESFLHQNATENDREAQ